MQKTKNQNQTEISQLENSGKKTMCIALATTNQTTKPSLAVLRACELANPHGGGIAWRVGKGIRWEKGIGAEEIHEIIRRNEGPFLIHFRIATVGAPKPELCHPFPVGGDASLALSGKASSVIAHNGTWHNWKSVIERAARSLKAKLPQGPISDSRAMAWLVAQVGARAFNGVTGSRFAYFTRNGIKLFGDWHKLDGFYASNLNWRWRLDRPLPKRERTREDSRQRSHDVSEYWKHFSPKDAKGSGIPFTRGGKSLFDQVQFELDGGCE